MAIEASIECFWGYLHYDVPHWNKHALSRHVIDERRRNHLFSDYNVRHFLSLPRLSPRPRRRQKVKKGEVRCRIWADCIRSLYFIPSTPSCVYLNRYKRKKTLTLSPNPQRPQRPPNFFFAPPRGERVFCVCFFLRSKENTCTVGSFFCLYRKPPANEWASHVSSFTHTHTPLYFFGLLKPLGPPTPQTVIIFLCFHSCVRISLFSIPCLKKRCR